jgi:hypothetical protein
MSLSRYRFMFDRRVEPRLLCAELMDVEWKDQNGGIQRGVVHLEDISYSGACLQVERRVPLGTALHIAYPSGALTGVVRYCEFNQIGYFLGIEFAPGQRWSQQQFHPQHLLDVRQLVDRAIEKATNAEPAAN